MHIIPSFNKWKGSIFIEKGKWLASAYLVTILDYENVTINSTPTSSSRQRGILCVFHEDSSKAKNKKCYFT